MTAPHVSIRTVRAASGDPSRNGFVRLTNVGVRSILPKVSMDSPCCLIPCSTAPNQDWVSRFSDRPLLMNSIQPIWMRKLHSATMFSMAVLIAQMNTAWENSWA